MDEAKKKSIYIDLKGLEDILGIPVVATIARDGSGLSDLKDAIRKVSKAEVNPKPLQIDYGEDIEKAIRIISKTAGNLLTDKLNSRWVSIRLMEESVSLVDSIEEYLGFNLYENISMNNKLNIAKEGLLERNMQLEDVKYLIVSRIIETGEEISHVLVTYKNKSYNLRDEKIDDIVTSRLFGMPIMIALLGLIFWLTIEGANVPSALLAKGLFFIEDKLSIFFMYIGSPLFLHDILVLGIYRTLAWVISVMLPPMAIFFPLFTLLEDLGYLPRIAFNLDYHFKKACAHGKQALTMCMGFGCNAAGIISCRIIDSPRERLIAIITNNFVPCNGRFPILIAVASMFIGTTGVFGSFIATLSILFSIIFGVIITLLISRFLSKTILKGLPSSFTLELPPYRRPQIGKVIVRSIFDRTLFVLGRAVVVAAPAGLIIWIMANITLRDLSLLTHFATFLDPFSKLLGLDGYIMMAFILGLPANEIVIPILIMSYMSKASMLELSSLNEMKQLFIQNGWTFLTAICTMIFTLNHWPCATTLLTIKKETGSLKWTFISFIVPTITGIVLCFIVAQVARILALV